MRGLLDRGLRGRIQAAQERVAEILQPGRTRGFTREQEAWIDRVRTARPGAVAVLHPDWRGIRSSTQNLFAHVLYAKDLNAARTARTAAQIIESGCEKIVFSGFPAYYGPLIRLIKRRAPERKIYVIWHGSFLQSGEAHDWACWKVIAELCRDGLIHRWGFVKEGMAEVVGKSAGFRTGFVMNYVRAVPQQPSIPLIGGPHLGIWAFAPSWRKLPYAMLAGAAIIPGAEVFAIGHGDGPREFSDFLRLNITLRTAIPQADMPAALARMHLNLYVTLSECTPMVPLESLAVGAPCLLGPTSHLFEDHAYLHSRLVVPYPDRALVIARYIEQALGERDQIIRAYAQYAPCYSARAREALSDFLEVDHGVPL